MDAIGILLNPTTRGFDTQDLSECGGAVTALTATASALEHYLVHDVSPDWLAYLVDQNEDGTTSAWWVTTDVAVQIEEHFASPYDAIDWCLNHAKGEEG
jgi:hypothetical protein